MANHKTCLPQNSYNRYLAVAARVVRRSLTEEQRIKAERRGEMELKFAKWEVSLLGFLFLSPVLGGGGELRDEDEDEDE